MKSWFYLKYSLIHKIFITYKIVLKIVYIFFYEYSNINKFDILYFIIFKLIIQTTKSSVQGTTDFPVDVDTDTRSNATGLVAGYTEYCDAGATAPDAACTFTEDSATHSLVIDDFSDCDVSAQYITADNVVSTTFV